MLIPKGSTIFLSVWSLHRDEKYFPEIDTFNPDRFLEYPKLANEYAVAADYNNRDKIPHPLTHPSPMYTHS
jgi:cytochrome P450